MYESIYGMTLQTVSWFSGTISSRATMHPSLCIVSCHSGHSARGADVDRALISSERWASNWRGGYKHRRDGKVPIYGWSGRYPMSPVGAALYVEVTCSSAKVTWRYCSCALPQFYFLTTTCWLTWGVVISFHQSMTYRMEFQLEYRLLHGFTTLQNRDLQAFLKKRYLINTSSRWIKGCFSKRQKWFILTSWH